MSKLNRNSPCPCGSGRKLKDCCLGKVPEDELRARVSAAQLKPMPPEQVFLMLLEQVPNGEALRFAVAAYRWLDWVYKLKARGVQPPRVFNPADPDVHDLVDSIDGPEADKLTADFVMAALAIQGTLNSLDVMAKMQRMSRQRAKAAHRPQGPN